MYYKPSYSDSLRADIQPSYKDSLTHFGILGMKWGVRRFEDKNGHLTAAGKKRYDNWDDDDYYDPAYAKKIKEMNKDSDKRTKELVETYKKMSKAKLDKLYDDEDDLIGDFEYTDKGSRLFERMDKYADLDGPDGYKKYQKACIDYSTAMADHISKNLLNRYGRDACDQFADISEYPKGKTFEDRCRKQHVFDDYYG